MKEYLFRAWLPVQKKMVYPKAIWFLEEKIAIEYDNEKGERCIDSDKFFELMQYTGLTDKSGVKIFEGDIIEVRGKVDIHRHNYEVYFNDNLCFSIRNKDFKGESPLKVVLNGTEYRIIGNIHDHKRLLKGSDNAVS